MKVIITGATGMVGEGVLLECLQNEKVTAVLSISRRTAAIQHPKLKELLVEDFTKLSLFRDAIAGYDACFYCAGVSSVGMKEDKYRYITYDTTLAFAKSLLEINSEISFIYVSGGSTDSTEQGKVMWARVKGKTENDLAKLPVQKGV
ncbi:NAD-dependent epimerase/dehydratase family protein [Sphingobacterium multivorum]|uniref:NAD-dependent epimerase/dehydratase family protein n=1 Tax=Sphingobacterium multivorum TaxID=28454 RepID=UPI00289A006F|nr:NAD-dependent epimerase/dehydratase family protein [Sphingobacterium multivorum]